MTLRAIIRDGLIDVHGRLPDGTEVDILPVKPAKPARPARRVKSKKKAAKKKTAKRARRRTTGSITESPFFGMWKDREDFKGKTAVEIVAMLRAQARQRRPD